MRITASAVSLTVDDVVASRDFLITHFGFHVNMADEQSTFVSLGRKDSAMTVIFLRRGNKVLPEGFRDQRATGLILAFTVKGLASEERRLREEGVTITMPLREEPWGERLFQVTDPNGILIELVEWIAPKGSK
ncbi:MAG: VOC family protein [Chlamydiota bacterium]